MCIVLGGHWMRRDSPYIHVGHLRFGSSTSRYLIIKRNKEKGKLHLSVFRYRVGRRNVFQSGIYQYMLPGTYQSIIFYHMDTSQVQTYITSAGLLTEEISPMVQRTARQIPWLSTYLGAALSAHSPSLYIYDSVKARQLIIPLCNVHINHACSKVLYSKCLYEVPRQNTIRTVEYMHSQRDTGKSSKRDYIQSDCYISHMHSTHSTLGLVPSLQMEVTSHTINRAELNRYMQHHHIFRDRQELILPRSSSCGTELACIQSSPSGPGIVILKGEIMKKAWGWEITRRTFCLSRLELFYWVIVQNDYCRYFIKYFILLSFLDA